MAVDPNEIPAPQGEDVGGVGEEPIAPDVSPPEPELAEGEVVPLEEFRRLESNVAELQSKLDARAADAEGRAEEADARADAALQYAEQVQQERERDGEAFLASLDEEEREKARPGFERWRQESRAELQQIRDKVNVPARERRRVADQFEIDVAELADLTDPVEMRDKALSVMKAKKEEPKAPPEEPAPKKKRPVTTRGTIQPPGGAPPPPAPELVTPDMVRDAGERGDMEEVKRLRDLLAEQRRKQEAGLTRR